MSNDSGWSDFLDANQEKFLVDLEEFLAIPSISTLPEHKSDIRKAASWLADKMKNCGLENVEIIETDRHPIVYADWLHADNAPTVLLYGHYDVQPVDPIELWQTHPFEPDVRDGYIYARGAYDMKANVLIGVQACEAHLSTNGTLPVNVKFVIEGEEELASPTLPKWLEQNRDKVACDFVINADSVQTDKHFPQIITGLKGALGVSIDVHTASSDLHSGLAGGIVHNALHVISEIVASLHNEDKTISIDGFYDDVIEPSAEERKMCARVLAFSEENSRQQFGVEQLISERGFTSGEIQWFRPNLSVNGLWGGYQGEGLKTVIPCEAHAKLSFRLVVSQKPDDIFDKLKRHVQAQTPTGVNIDVRQISGFAEAYVTPESHQALKIADEAIQSEMDISPVHVRLGASVPILPTVKNVLGAEIVSLGFSNGGNLHAPNEHQSLSMYHLGSRVYARFFDLLGSFRY